MKMNDAEILSDRAKRLAKVKTEASSEKCGVLLVNMAGSQYGIMMNSVDSVAKMNQLCYLPGASPGVLGTSLNRGALTPIIDFFSLMNCPKKEPNNYNSIVFLAHEKLCFGILVDVIYGVEILDRLKWKTLLDSKNYGISHISEENHAIIHIPTLFKEYQSKMVKHESH